MATSAGPNISLDGLVFGYDSSYPISDNDIATRFSPGKPTTNLNTDPLHSTRSDGDTLSSAVWGGDAGSAEFKTNTSPDEGGLMYINKNTSNPAGTGGVYNDFPSTRFTLTNGLTYTRSWWCKSNINQTLSGHICSCNRDSDNTYIIGGSISLTTEWQRISETFTYTGPTSTDWQFRHINYNTSNVYIANVQLEVNGAASPFLNGTRSSTQSLIDLKESYNIDVDDVSFDSTGKTTFDGTDDYLLIPLTGVNIDDACTIEGVLKRNSTPSAWRTFFNIKHASSNTPFFEFRSSANSQSIYTDYYNGTDYTTSPTAFTTGEFGHAVSCYDGVGNIKMYFNGELTATKTGVPDFALGTSPRLTVGRAYSNDRYTDISAPVVKVYDRVLTAIEVKQNFNAYKKRFGI